MRQPGQLYRSDKREIEWDADCRVAESIGLRSGQPFQKENEYIDFMWKCFHHARRNNEHERAERFFGVINEWNVIDDIKCFDYKINY